MRHYMQERPQTSGIHKQGVTPLTSSRSWTLSVDYLGESALPATDLETKLTNWASKSLHGRYHQQLNQPGTDKEATCTWLRRSDIRPETEGFIFATQEEVIPTRNYEKQIHQGPKRRNWHTSSLWLFIGNYQTCDCLTSKNSPKYIWTPTPLRRQHFPLEIVDKVSSSWKTIFSVL